MQHCKTTGRGRHARHDARRVRPEAKKAGLPASIKLPSVDLAGKAIDSSNRARAFAGYMRIHALEATGRLRCSQTLRYATADGKGTDDLEKAQK